MAQRRNSISHRFFYNFRIHVTAAVLFLVLLAWVGPALAGDSNFIWSVATDTGRTYIMGSIHTLKSASYPLPRAYRSAYDHAATVLFETDTTRMNEPAMQARLMALGLYPQGESIRDHVSPETYRLLSRKLTSLGLDPARFQRFKPWLTALNLVMMELQHLGYDPRHGVDAHFLERARRDGKEVLYLEAPESQIELLASMDREEQEKFLLQSLQEVEVLAQTAEEMTGAWLDGDTGALEEIVKRGFKGFPGLYRRFMLDRNMRWLPDLQALIKRGGDSLVIVGAGHLVGDRGIIKLLENRGYSVRQH